MLLHNIPEKEVDEVRKIALDEGFKQATSVKLLDDEVEFKTSRNFSLDDALIVCLFVRYENNGMITIRVLENYYDEKQLGTLSKKSGLSDFTYNGKFLIKW